MYTALARFGYGIAKSLRPSKVKKLLKPAYDKATKKAFTGTKMASGEAKAVKALSGAAQKGYSGYRKAYGATLGTSSKRKVTSGVLGGYTLGSMFDDA
jgi:hypothetical protein